MTIETLAQTIHERVNDPRKYLTLVYGAAGVGKTSWLSQIPDYYLLWTEPGVDGIAPYGHGILSWEDFLDTCILLKAGQESNWKGQRPIAVVGIDTYDRLWALAGEWICQHVQFPKQGGGMAAYDRIEDVPFGRGYQAANKLCISKILKLKMLGFGIVLTSHVKERTIKWRGQDLTKCGPDLAPSAADAIVNECGAVGYMDIEENIEKNEQGLIVKSERGRYMYWQPTFTFTAKHKLVGFPERLEMPLNRGWEIYTEAFQEAFAKLTVTQ